VTLTLTTTGSGQLTASGTFSGSGGIVHVLPGVLASVKLRTDTLNQGIEFGTLTLSVGDSVRLYTAGYDADQNFISNKRARYGVTGSSTLLMSWLTVSNDSTSVLLKPTAASSGSVSDTSNVGNYTDTTGTITVTNTASITQVRIKRVAGVDGAAASGKTLRADQNDTLYVGGYDVFGNYIGDVVGAWYSCRRRGARVCWIRRSPDNRGGCM
jgi:hypothetical protein